jgi:hypothetical protein
LRSNFFPFGEPFAAALNLISKEPGVKLILAILALSLSPLMAAAALADEQIERLQFDDGGNSKLIKGRIVGRQTVTYVVQTRSGQELSVGMTTNNRSAYFNVSRAGEPEAIFIGSTQGLNFSSQSPKRSEYLITVYLMRNAARRNEVANFSLRIDVDGRPSAGTTPGNASARIPCAAFIGQPMMSCLANVVREGRGDATLRITLPGQGKRTIFFRNGRPVSSDSPRPLTSVRNRDLTIIRIGGSERYEVPDAFILGG